VEFAEFHGKLICDDLLAAKEDITFAIGKRA